jgi:acyl-CoA synthetase (AMP-forming)/AMP-acid ligase II
VGEAAVIGVPDPVMGEKVGAVIVPLPGAVVDEKTIITHCRERLADFKVPQYLAARAEPLPRNAGGKVLKPVLRTETRWDAPLR